MDQYSVDLICYKSSHGMGHVLIQPKCQLSPSTAASAAGGFSLRHRSDVEVLEVLRYLLVRKVLSEDVCRVLDTVHLKGA